MRNRRNKKNNVTIKTFKNFHSSWNFSGSHALLAEYFVRFSLQLVYFQFLQFSLPFPLDFFRGSQEEWLHGKSLRRLAPSFPGVKASWTLTSYGSSRCNKWFHSQPCVSRYKNLFPSFSNEDNHREREK